MNDVGFLEMLAALAGMLIDQMWLMVAGGFDLLRNLGSFHAGLAVLAVFGVAFGVAFAMQARLEKKLTDRPKEDVPIWQQELIFSLPAIAMFLMALPAIIIAALVRGVATLVGALFSSSEDEEDDKKQKEKEEDVSVVVATLGPSFMWAGLVVAGLWLLSWASEPLLAHMFDLSPGHSAWQYVILGRRPELEWYLPLGRFPYLGLLATLALWMTLWWWAARIVRLVLGSELGANLAARIDQPGVLESWRTWFGARRLFETDASYRRWAVWMVIGAVPLLALGWGSVATEPYRMDPSMFSVSLVLWLSWVLHLALSGHCHLVDEEDDEEPEPEPIEGRDWANVLADLRGRLGAGEPAAIDLPRQVRPREEAGRSVDDRLLSPLLDEVLPDDDRPTKMQQAVLETLSHQAYVHVDPPTELGELALGRTSGTGIDDASGLRHRNQVVIAPDGSGKTTLAMLAACNHVLVHTRTTLVVTRDEDAAERFTELLRSTLEPSTLRWTVRVRKAGTTLVHDLSQGILPDVIVTSLHQLVVGILDEPRTYAPFLKNLGLIIVDDVESFCGPVEIHMQLAFRRLTMRVRQLLDVQQLGEDSGPVTLVLGVDSMHDTATWAKTLCGIDAVTRVFDYEQSRQRWTPEPDEEGRRRHIDGRLASLEEAPAGRYHLFYELNDFTTGSGERLRVSDIIDSCERLDIAWHYRQCGDLLRGKGSQNLRLDQEPEHDVDSPLDACIVFLEGPLSEVRREVDHLWRAGLQYHPEESSDSQSLQRPVPIAFITIVDPDERAALGDLAGDMSLGEVLRTLPRPVVRAPFGRAVEAHLSADLVDTWMEVADVLDVFGNTAVGTLSQLADAGLLSHESRTDLDDAESGYTSQLHVRVPARAIATDEEALDEDDTGLLLAPRVNQVELPPGETVAIRDRTNLTIIDRTDRESARHLYYPGRIFETARGRFVVVGAASEAGRADATSPVSEQDMLVEPYLNDEISSPRRRTRLRALDARVVLPGERAPGEAAGESLDSARAEPVFIGDYPVAVSLGPVECRTRHLATYRLDPHRFEVRQRILFGGGGRSKPRPDILRTVALGIIANPGLEVVDDADCPRLELAAARLVAAAMRAVLPSMYRGSSVDIQVALNVAGRQGASRSEAAPASLEPDHVLGPNDGFFLYDPHLGGNGAARAIHRDGVELLLRLCRLYLRRVPDTRRLRARYDYWLDADKLTGRRSAAQGDEDGEQERADEARRLALAWLDSRLRPEAGDLSVELSFDDHEQQEEGP
jgi:hypothetical protein